MATMYHVYHINTTTGTKHYIKDSRFNKIVEFTWKEANDFISTLNTRKVAYFIDKVQKGN